MTIMASGTYQRITIAQNGHIINFGRRFDEDEGGATRIMWKGALGAATMTLKVSPNGNDWITYEGFFTAVDGTATLSGVSGTKALGALQGMHLGVEVIGANGATDMEVWVM